MGAFYADRTVAENYYCELYEHGLGEFSIGERNYMPSWPRGLPEDYEELEVGRLVITTLSVARKHHEQFGNYPKRLYSILYPSKKISVLLID